MKNIHVIPTDKSVRVGRFVDTQELILRSVKDIPRGENVNIYITSDEEIKEGGYVFWEGKIYKYRDFMKMKTPVYTDYFSIILTTDQDLIKDGVQSIDDEFLEWFVKNPSCEVIKVNKLCYGALSGFADAGYKIIIPKEEPKQERTYSEEEVGELVYNIIGEYAKHYGIMIDGAKLNELFEQFKKK